MNRNQSPIAHGKRSSRLPGPSLRSFIDQERQRAQAEVAKTTHLPSRSPYHDEFSGEEPEDPERVEAELLALPPLDDPAAVFAWGFNSILSLAVSAPDLKVRLTAAQYVCDFYAEGKPANQTLLDRDAIRAELIGELQQQMARLAGKNIAGAEDGQEDFEQSNLIELEAGVLGGHGGT